MQQSRSGTLKILFRVHSYSLLLLSPFTLFIRREDHLAPISRQVILSPFQPAFSMVFTEQRLGHRRTKFLPCFIQSPPNGFLTNVDPFPLQTILDITGDRECFFIGEFLQSVLSCFGMVERGRPERGKSVRSFDFLNRSSQYLTAFLSHLTAFATAIHPSFGPNG